MKKNRGKGEDYEKKIEGSRGADYKKCPAPLAV